MAADGSSLDHLEILGNSLTPAASRPATATSRVSSSSCGSNFVLLSEAQILAYYYPSVRHHLSFIEHRARPKDR